MPFVRKEIGLLVLVLTGCGSAGGNGTGGRGGGAGPGHGGGPAGGSFDGAGSTGAAGVEGSTLACTITATSTFAAAMPNVAIVTWSTSLETLTGAEIDFAPEAGGAILVAPVDLTQPDYRTLLLGMKQSTSYVFRIVARAAGGSCVSDPYTITTGALAAPAVSATIMDGEAHDRGFIVTSTGLSGSTSFVIDPDGDVVWAASGPSTPSRAHLSWDGTRMYMMALNVRNNGTGNVESVAMDGTGATSFSGLSASHHDLTAIPGGFATLLWNQAGTDAPCSLVEVAEASGAITTVVADMGAVYNSSAFHTNSVHYYPGDDTYTVGDRNPSCYVKLTRGGQLVWQFGGTTPKDPSKFFTGVPTWSVNHGHQLLPDGTFVFFNNGANEAWSYRLDETAMTATKVLGYTATGAASSVLGDAQRLPNGNYLVTFSNTGQIHEISPSGTLVAKFTSSSFGYAEFRESLYGPPPY